MRELTVGEPFELLDDGLGWAWGYAGEERRVLAAGGKRNLRSFRPGGQP